MRRHRTAGDRGGPGRSAPLRASSTHGSPTLWIMLAVVAVAIAAMVWRLPTTLDASVTRPVAVGVEFDYSAATAPSDPIHRGDQIRFGDPVFLELNEIVDARVRVGGLDTALGDGATLEVSALLRSEAGWTQSMVDLEPVGLSTNPTAVALRLDFGGAVATAERIDRATGIAGALSVVVAASVELDDGRRETASWVFDLTGRRARLTDAADDRRIRTPDEPGGALTMLSWVVQESIERAGTIELGQVALRHGTARIITVGFALVAVTAAISSVVVAWRARRRGEASWLVARHRAHLVEAGEGFAAPDDAIALASFGGLVAVGADAQQSIVADTRDGAVAFYVFDGAQAYCYRASDRCDAAGEPAARIAPPPSSAADPASTVTDHVRGDIDDRDPVVVDGA